jgi:hypothetical protein
VGVVVESPRDYRRDSKEKMVVSLIRSFNRKQGNEKEKDMAGETPIRAPR